MMSGWSHSTLRREMKGRNGKEKKLKEMKGLKYVHVRLCLCVYVCACVYACAIEIYKRKQILILFSYLLMMLKTTSKIYSVK